MDALDRADLARERCLQCGSPLLRPLLVLTREGIAPGCSGHQIVYRHAVIVACDACGSGWIEVRRHDCFDFEEVFDHNEWFVCDRASIDTLRTALAACDRPLLESCACPLHRSLRKTSLPVRERTYGFEDESHIQPIAIVLQDGVPRIVR